MSEDLHGDVKLLDFVEKLKELRATCGGPSLRKIADTSGRLTALYGERYRDLPALSPSALSNALNGRRKGPLTWEWVASFVLSCQRWGWEAGALREGADLGPGSLAVWRMRWLDTTAGDPATAESNAEPNAEDASLGSIPPRDGRPADDPAGHRSSDPVVEPAGERADGRSAFSSAGVPPVDPAVDSSAEPTDSSAEAAHEPTDEATDGSVDSHGDGQVENQAEKPGERPVEGLVGGPVGGTARTRGATGAESLTERRYRNLFGEHGVDLLHAADDELDVDAACRLGILLACHGRPSEATAWLQRPAAEDNGMALALVGTGESRLPGRAAEFAYELGQDEAGRRRAKAGPVADVCEVYFEAAARAGHVDACYRIAVRRRAAGRDADAVRWFARAARRGHRNASGRLAEIERQIMWRGAPDMVPEEWVGDA